MRLQGFDDKQRPVIIKKLSFGKIRDIFSDVINKFLRR
jgi:hypothetical protein